MKILRIQGQNIASLCEAFDIDLTSGALGDAGLFAIAGPTGAGKSTLLDVICLALFDTTPRLSERGGVLIGRAEQDEKHRVQANDVRGLLARGTAAGFATVDFRGVDGKSYRAKWEVRRARNKSTGRLQNQTMSLMQLDTNRLWGDKKTEVLQLIEARLGLTFDQFKRSAMLAQGDFAAFLHADDRSRADLLERVTGTAIYSTIGALSYERTRSEQKAFDALAAEAEKLGRLTPEAREVLKEQVREHTEALTQAEATHAAYTTTTTWFDTRSQLLRKRDNDERQVQQAVATEQAAAPRRHVVQRIQALTPLRLPLQRRDDAKTALDGARSAHTEATEAVRTADTQHKATLATLAARSKDRDAQRALGETLEPVLNEARALDVKRATAQEHASEAKSKQAQANKVFDDAERAHAALARTVTQTETSATRARQWLTDNPSVEAIAGAFGPLTDALNTVAERSETLTRLVARQPALRAAQERADHDHTTARDTELKAAGIASDAHSVLKQAREAIPLDARTTLDARRAQNDAVRARLQTLSDAQQRAQDALNTEQKATLTLAEQQVVHTQAQTQIQATQARISTAEGQLTEAQRNLDTLGTALTAEELRSQLADDEPCPVCGATEHPWADGGVLNALHQAAHERVLALRSSIQTDTAEQQTASRLAATADAQRKTARERIDEAQALAARAQTQWDSARSDQSDVPESPTDTTSVDRLSALHASADAERQAIEGDHTALTAQERALVTAQSKSDTAVKARETAATALQKAELAARNAKEALDTHSREQVGAEQQRREALQAAQRILGDDAASTAQADADANSLLQRLTTQVDTFTAHRATVAAADTSLQSLRPQLATAAATETSAKQTLTDRTAVAVQAQEDAERLRLQRMALLDGRAVDEVVAEQRRRDEAVNTAFSTADDAVDLANAALAAATGALIPLSEALSRAAKAFSVAQAVLNTALEAHDTDETAARALLDKDAAWVATEIQELRALSDAVAAARTLLADRIQALTEHDETAPEQSEEQARVDALASHTAMKAARELHADHAAALRRDDAARTQGSELDQQLTDQQQVVDRWAVISTLIGSADGKVFRTFAQGLTLDALLRYANHHLAELARRYRLERVPGEDLALQVVDQDMGDEVRAIPSLSGGETFLASLALALGLSSLSASQTPVESLFIDEGFGTLDRETLGIALGALDTLQASGRQVGLISHVEGLADHIGVSIRVSKIGSGRSRVTVPERAPIAISPRLTP